jgi:hypothetical protein
LNNGLIKDLKVYPNPVSQSAMISFAASENGKAAITASDELGREVLMLNETISEGLFQKEIDLSNFPSGIYFVRCTFNDEVLIKKIIKE